MNRQGCSALASILWLTMAAIPALAQDQPAVPLPRGVKAVWDLASAHRETTPARERIEVDAAVAALKAGEQYKLCGTLFDGGREVKALQGKLISIADLASGRGKACWPSGRSRGAPGEGSAR